VSLQLEYITSEVFVCPDGGYGWFIVLGSFISLFWCAGFIRSYGVIFSEILEAFPEASVGLASWIPARYAEAQNDVVTGLG
jgi:hypothetical protein